MLKTFISYKWEGEAHDRWVKKVAGDLRAAGIDAQLDKWEIRFGDSLTEYMTSRIDEADVILCIISRCNELECTIFRILDPQRNLDRKHPAWEHQCPNS